MEKKRSEVQRSSLSPNIFIFGLGNPGREYKLSRHNLGFMAIDSFAGRLDFPDFSHKDNYDISSKEISGKYVFLIKPLTFMNLSGRAVKEVLIKNGIFDLPSRRDESTVVVIHDDLDLKFGSLKLKFGGSGGSHNGIISVIESLKNKNFIRLKLGINSLEKAKFNSGADFVLSRFSKEEMNALPDFLDKVTNLLQTFISGGISKAMNGFNKK